MRAINEKLRKAIESEGRLARIEGSWWQFSLTRAHRARAVRRQPAQIARDRDGALEITGRSWREDGSLSARYWSEAAKEKEGAVGHLLLLEGRAAAATRTRRSSKGRARSGSSPPIAPPATSRRAPTRDPELNARTSGVYWRADPDDMSILDGTRRPEARGADRRAAHAVEVDQERLS